MTTAFHAKYLAHELTKRSSSDNVEKLAAVLADAQVDLNPHQVEAALFAFRSPFSKGAILADEVGLGKTIEAGLLIAQKWAERKRRILVILPANLRKQWSQELADKFFIPCAILESKSFNETIRQGNLNPFQQDAVVLCSYQFARSKEPYLKQTKWDLVVIDEAHRLRNVYRGSSKIAQSIKGAVAPYPKVLLTATPLQNTLLELFGLVSIIDDYAFGDIKSFKARFARLGNESDFTELKDRLKPLCKRTLRRQVMEYVPYTNRHALVQEFTPSAEEQRLYDLVSDYLQQPNLYALPPSQRKLMTLILRKLLASSTYAISGTLTGLVSKLEDAEKRSVTVEAPPDEIPEDWETIDELADEWEGDDDAPQPRDDERLTSEQLEDLRREKEQLKEFLRLAQSIATNSKGEVLLTALRRGFAASAQAQQQGGAATLQQKAVIFTESRRTQEYLFRVLEQTEFKGKVMLFNGTNTDPLSKSIYQRWLAKHAGTDRVTGSPTADMRAALVDHFREDASILIATEAAAEGINLQFCNLVVNYDLPWNPQRIEQRIGRCHRYGQKFDVVVVNFLNKNNAADARVYELLDQKFALFNGVFGASDEVLGAIESGVDFEKRIADIYQRCRSPEQIKSEFDQLQQDLNEKIVEGQRDAREKLLDNFDQEVVEKVRVQTSGVLDRFNQQLWDLTRFVLADSATFDDDKHSFMLSRNPFVLAPDEVVHAGPYRMGKGVTDANTYRVGHPLAQHVLERGRTLSTDTAEVVFRLTGSGRNIAILEPLKGRSGWLACSLHTITSIETADTILLAGVTDDGDTLDEAQCRRLFDLPGGASSCAAPNDSTLATLAAQTDLARQAALAAAEARDGEWFDSEIQKLDRWAEDRKLALEQELRDLDRSIAYARRAAVTAATLAAKLEAQKAVKELEAERARRRKDYFMAQDEVDAKKGQVLDEIAARLQRSDALAPLFTIRWRLA